VIEEARADGWKPASDATGIEETPTRFAPYGRGAQGAGHQGKSRAGARRQRECYPDHTCPEDRLARIRGLKNESAAVKDAVASRDVSEGLDALGEIGERQHVGFYCDEADGGGRAQGKPLAGGTFARLTRSRGAGLSGVNNMSCGSGFDVSTGLSGAGGVWSTVFFLCRCRRLAIDL
jgi:hypothetical protein